MMLVSNWKKILTTGYSMWVAYLAAIFGALGMFQQEVIALLPFLQGYIPPSAFSALSVYFTVLVPLGRVIKQVALETKVRVAHSVDDAPAS